LTSHFTSAFHFILSLPVGLQAMGFHSIMCLFSQCSAILSKCDPSWFNLSSCIFYFSWFIQLFISFNSPRAAACLFGSDISRRIFLSKI
jgi:hypothetical protein